MAKHKHDKSRKGIEGWESKMEIKKAYDELVYWVEQSKKTEGFGIEENIEYYRNKLERLIKEKATATLGYAEVVVEGLEQVVFLTETLLSGGYIFTRSVTVDGAKARFELNYLSESQKVLIDTLVSMLKLDVGLNLKYDLNQEYINEAVANVADLVIAEGKVK